MYSAHDSLELRPEALAADAVEYEVTRVVRVHQVVSEGVHERVDGFFMRRAWDERVPLHDELHGDGRGQHEEG